VRIRGGLVSANIGSRVRVNFGCKGRGQSVHVCFNQINSLYFSFLEDWHTGVPVDASLLEGQL
jgi:hypothetical protein